ncbi:MAG: ion transporter [Bacteroides sp.]|nr:ion transporter [Bacteroides sp.]MCM1094853.1 ion transporter [Terasakiella sp.]
MTLDIREFRHRLGLVFDDNLGTRQWYNIVDWIIVGMILLSSIEIFLATFSWSPGVERALDIVNTATLWFFVVEVTLRIWAAPEQSRRFKGFMGRVRYCLTGYGFIDFISTYPFLIQYFVPLPVGGLRVLRVARVIRIFRITRYAKSFNLLFDSIREKKNELIVSMQFLLIVTFILSLILYFHEHEAQPDVYNNGFVSVLWAFAQYIGDPGQFADTPPVTFVGRAIACIVGILGIAIVAVPAGILGAGFTETIERENHKKEIKENATKLRLCFERKLDRPTGFQACPPFQSMITIQARQMMSENDIIEAVNSTPGYRISNLATTIPFANNPVDRLVVEYFEHNRPYGICIDRGSRFTVIATSSYIDACTGFFAYYLAMIGGFNYVSREFGKLAPVESFYNIKGTPQDAGFKDFMADVDMLLSRPGAWSLTSLVSSGAQEPDYDTDVHFGTGSPKGQETIGNLITDKEVFANFYRDISEVLGKDENIKCDLGKYHNTSMPGLFLRKLARSNEPNDFVMRVSWRVMLWSPRRLEVARKIAETINRDILGIDGNPEVERLKVKDFGFL